MVDRRRQKIILLIIATLATFASLGGTQKSPDYVEDGGRRRNNNVTTNGNWNYSDPSGWGALDDACSYGVQQSPINIVSSAAVSDAKLAQDPLLFVNYHDVMKGILSNDGHTVKFSLPPFNSSTASNRVQPKIAGAGLKGEYIFEHFNFHWGNPSSCANGSSSCQGSEHKLDGVGGVGEIQFVHYNSKYGSYVDAARYPDGLVIASFFFELVTNESLIVSDYVPVVTLFSTIPFSGNKVLADIYFYHLIPIDARRPETVQFYRYDGSMTAPPCSETVTWIVFENRIATLASTMDLFRKATVDAVDRGAKKTPMVNNYRPTQPLSGRTVRSNRKPALPAGRQTNNNGTNSANHLTPSRLHCLYSPWSLPTVSALLATFSFCGFLNKLRFS